jgi:hypothetical protein
MNFLRSLWYRYKEWRWERKCIKHLGMKPQKMYVSKEAYDALVAAINAPPDPEKVERLREIMNKKAPWDELWETEND